MRRLLCLLSAVLAGLMVLGFAPAAFATPSTPQATLNGTPIDLSAGWGAAKGCVVTSQAAVECFTSIAALKAAESPLLATAGVSANGGCSSYLELFSGASFTGSELDLFEAGVWLNLSAYGFADRTVSFINGACQSYLAKGVNGGVPWYANSGPWVEVVNMGLYWNDTIQSVYIA
jgi:hypothetical protein